MKLIKRSILAILSACLLLGASPLYASAAGCDHKDRNGNAYPVYQYRATGQYKNYFSSHTVAVGRYTDGTPINVTCNVTIKKQLYIMYCTNCNSYAFVAEIKESESHTVVH